MRGIDPISLKPLFNRPWQCRIVSHPDSLSDIFSRRPVKVMTNVAMFVVGAPIFNVQDDAPGKAERRMPHKSFVLHDAYDVWELGAVDFDTRDACVDFGC